MIIELGEGLDEEGNQIPSYGFEHKGIFVTDPYISECGRFEVDPYTYYGLHHSKANEIVKLNLALTRTCI
jgi:hypothetical protein